MRILRVFLIVFTPFILLSASTQKLTRAIENGDRIIIEEMINEGINPNERDKNNETPIFHAVRKGDIETVQTLIENGASVSISTKNDILPIYIAIGNNNINMVTTLINAGAVVNMEALEIAIKLHHNDIFKILLDKSNCESLDLLFSAINYGNREVMSYLISKDIDLTYMTDDSTNMLMLSSLAGNLNAVKECLELGIDINSRNNAMLTPLMLAATGGDRIIGQYLLDQGADINANTNKKDDPFNSNFTAIGSAINYENSDFLEFLLKSGADITFSESLINDSLEIHEFLNKYNVKAYNYDQFSPLIIVMLTMDFRSTELLLEYGVDPNMKALAGITALHHAASRKNVDYSKLLVKYNANINAKDMNGDTPLHLAAEYNKDTLVTEFLINTGARINEMNNNGDTPLEKAYNAHNDIQFNYLYNALSEQGLNNNHTNALKKNNDSYFALGTNMGYVLPSGLSLQFVSLTFKIKPIYGAFIETGCELHFRNDMSGILGCQVSGRYYPWLAKKCRFSASLGLGWGLAGSNLNSGTPLTYSAGIAYDIPLKKLYNTAITFEIKTVGAFQSGFKPMIVFPSITLKRNLFRGSIFKK